MIDASFVEAVQTRQRIAGFTHNFYRYPARFSPLFVRSAIQTFTKPGDVVLDPFMGGGTTLVEACAADRRAVGTDINSLSVFISKTKTTAMSQSDLMAIRKWANKLVQEVNLHNPAVRDREWEARGYHRNINSKQTWPTRKILELSLPTIHAQLKNDYQKRFARCALLNTAQWALDCKKEIPSASAFRDQILKHIDAMCAGAQEFSAAITTDAGTSKELAMCLHRSAAELHLDRTITELSPPKLVVTSPPYPGVHVLYHRWQVQGRRETPAPYWIPKSHILATAPVR